MKKLALAVALLIPLSAYAEPEKTVEPAEKGGETVCIGPFADNDQDRDRYAALNRDIAADLIAGGYAVDGPASRWGRGFKSPGQQVLWMDHGSGPCITYSDADGPKLDAVTRFPGL